LLGVNPFHKRKKEKKDAREKVTIQKKGLNGTARERQRVRFPSKSRGDNKLGGKKVTGGGKVGDLKQPKTD